jgi:myo-inositol-1(or 4)-monophosphatase
LPVQNILYFAEKGKGAFSNDQPIPIIRDKGLRDSLIAFCIDYTEDPVLLNKRMEIYKYIVQNARNIRTTNSLIDFLYVAECRFGGVINFNTKVWDIAGLGLIISEAGGLMKNLDGSDIRFSISKELVNENFPVIAGSVQMVDALKKYSLIQTVLFG